MKKDYEKQAKSCRAMAKACAKRKDNLLAAFYTNAAAGFELRAEGRYRRHCMVIRKNKKTYTVETNRGRVIFETKKLEEAQKVLAYLNEKAMA
jgi:hypothetical protein